MSVLQAVVLGAVQGLTEFIPISSSGHLVLVPEALGWDQPGLAFDVLLHAASLVALVVYFRAELVALASGVIRGEDRQRRLLWLLAIGTVPAAIAGLAFGDFFEDQFSDASAAAVQLIITAGILVAGEQALRMRRGTRSLDDIRTPDSVAIGIAQAVSILPGISRSGATIATGLGLKITRDDSARFAFLLAIPALVGAALVEIPDLKGVSLGAGAGIAGFITSLITSYAAIWGLLRYLRTRTLYPFAAYCVIGGLFFLVVV